MLTLKWMDWGRAYVGPESGLGATFQDRKYLEHGLEAGERTWTKSGHVSLALGPHGTAGWAEMKEGQNKAL